jgi:hypothetical protein
LLFKFSYISEQHETSSSYIKRVQFLLMYIFQREQVFSKTDVANYTTEASDKMFYVDKNTFFWTKHQKTLIDLNPKRVLFTSEFGTGKTTLLKAKAKQLSRERYFKDLKKKSTQNESSLGKVNSQQIEASLGKIFIVLFTDQDALLTQSLKREFEDLKGHLEIFSLTSKLIYFYLISV